MSLETISGFYRYSIDVARLEANIKTQVGTLYYAPQIGFDLLSWLKPEAETGFRYSNDSFSAWIAQQAIKRGIVTTSVTSEVRDFTLLITYTLAGVSDQNTAIVEVPNNVMVN